MTLPGVTAGPPASSYDVVIVGAGVQGLATAYELARRGVTNVAVVDRSWPGGGASGRNGEMIRSAFSSREWTQLFELSLKRFAELSAELDFNILFSPSGYLVLASTEEEVAGQDAIAAAQAAYGVETEVLGAAQVRKLVPHLNPDLALGGILQRKGGFAHHDAVVWGYLRAAARAGVSVFSGIDVLGVTTAGGRVTGVRTSAGDIAADVVVNAAGTTSDDLNQTVGVELPLIKARLEMIVTEPVKPFLSCALASPHMLGYCHQTARGEFVGGTERPGADETDSLNTTYHMLRDTATKWVKLFPSLAGVRILRSWAGTVSQTPDFAPVLGEAPGVPGYWLSVGWIYGFMGAPGAAQLLAEAITTGRVPDTMAPFGAQRLLDGRLIEENTLVVISEEAS
ncbi:NAD(P)/FAD-dependent oxidoreductase [Nocardioides caldifontis]|uniref:NAD(P)/FAD-dependent oxidoreductase n=1 Tax=Nocardioides caldifontis TaxID=2588938 RepID=UPI0011DFA087|nr:FAD-dependent oxidoreductase [Nocardioides caldifontis]